MKLSIVIVCLAAIAVAVVHFRRERTRLRNEVHRLESRQIVLRRELWDQQVRLAWLIAPSELRRRAQDLALPMVDRAHPETLAPAGARAGAAPPRRR